MQTTNDIMNRIQHLRTVQDVEEILTNLDRMTDVTAERFGLLIALKEAVLLKCAEGHPAAADMARGLLGR